MSFCNLFNTFGNCYCNNPCQNRCNSCCNNYNRIFTNTIPRPPIIPTPPPPISSIGTLNLTTGAIASGATLPLGNQYFITGTNATYVPLEDEIILTDGIYRISYNASATGEIGTASLAIYSNGTFLPQSVSSATLAAETDLVTLASSIIIDARNTPVTLTLENNGTTDMTFNSLNVTVTQVR